MRSPRASRCLLWCLLSAEGSKGIHTSPPHCYAFCAHAYCPNAGCMPLRCEPCTLLHLAGLVPFRCLRPLLVLRDFCALHSAARPRTGCARYACRCRCIAADTVSLVTLALRVHPCAVVHKHQLKTVTEALFAATCTTSSTILKQNIFSDGSWRYPLRPAYPQTFGCSRLAAFNMSDTPSRLSNVEQQPEGVARLNRQGARERQGWAFGGCVSRWRV